MAEDVKVNQVRALLDQGVQVIQPESVWVDPSVRPGRIAPGVIIHPGCRIAGAATSIGPGSELGAEAPATVENCQLGHRVALRGGYFSGATFLNNANMGSGAHVRPGTLLEEEAGGAHTVGLKQTILMPFVTLGSLINFCDCLMAGGTSRKNHSEVGSSYIHFNYTPHQDKATASLIGDVPRGVMLNQAPIFLGGQGGLVGPARIAFGTVIPAGVVCRHDVLEPGTLTTPANATPGSRPYHAGVYGHVVRTVGNNLRYLGNLRALQVWYRHVRTRFLPDAYAKACHEGALHQLKSAVEERQKRLKELVFRLPGSIEALRRHGDTRAEHILREQELALRAWPDLEAQLHEEPEADEDARAREEFMKGLHDVEKGATYLECIARLADDARQAGTRWLDAIVDSVLHPWQSVSG